MSDQARGTDADPKARAEELLSYEGDENVGTKGWSGHAADVIRDLLARVQALEAVNSALNHEARDYRAWVERAEAAEAQVQELEAKATDRDEAHGYLSRLFKFLAPQCDPLPTLAGVATQLDNYIAGLRDKHSAAEAQVQALEREQETEEGAHALTAKELWKMRDRVKALEGDLGEAREFSRLQGTVTANRNTRIAALEREVAELKEYAQHKPDCPALPANHERYALESKPYRNCHCGFTSKPPAKPWSEFARDGFLKTLKR